MLSEIFCAQDEPCMELVTRMRREDLLRFIEAAEYRVNSSLAGPNRKENHRKEHQNQRKWEV
jgi:hypothetical protein